MAENEEGSPGGMTDEDRALLASVERGNVWLRAASCTLARRGAAFRRDHPDRARAILQALACYPLYKAGQFLFDLTEWEDFMVDGPEPELVPTTLDSRALARLAALLQDIQAHLDGDEGERPPPTAPPAVSATPDRDLPPLEAGFYLYENVVLGIVDSALPMLAARESP